MSTRVALQGLFLWVMFFKICCLLENFDFNNVNGSILIQQGRTLDSKRLGKRIGEIS
jgi:hypothetical protein